MRFKILNLFLLADCHSEHPDNYRDEESLIKDIPKALNMTI